MQAKPQHCGAPSGNFPHLLAGSRMGMVPASGFLILEASLSASPGGQHALGPDSGAGSKAKLLGLVESAGASPRSQAEVTRGGDP